MKANRKFIERMDAGMDATLGVVFMVAITVAIAAVVYYYVTTHLTSYKEDTVICGKIKYIETKNNWDKYGIVQMEDESVYLIYRIEDKDYSLMKFAYNNNCTVYFILHYYYDGDISIYGDSVKLMDCGC